MRGVTWTAALALLGGLAAPAAAQTAKVYEPKEPALLALGTYAAPGGGKTLSLSTGVGSSLFRSPGDPPGQFWALSDRGPNIACEDAKKVLGGDAERFCEGVKQGRVYPLPGYAPSIFRITLDDAAGTFAVAETVTIKRPDGTPVTGLPNPSSAGTADTALDGTGKPLEADPAALDTEALVRLPDGTFWLGEENAPSLVHVAADGTIRRRLVPAGTEGDFAGAGHPVEGTLPAILAKRQPNRGIESLALGGDGRFLYALLQNPLANPDADAFRKASNTRLLKVDAATGRPVAEFVYTLEPMANFRGEESKGASTARISELVHLAGERFLVDDRTDKTARLVAIDLAGATDILGGKWDDPATSPSLEQADLAAAGIVPAAESGVVLDSGDHAELPGKIEGVAVDGGALVLVNDDDFGIEGARTRIVRIEGLDLGG